MRRYLAITTNRNDCVIASGRHRTPQCIAYAAHEVASYV